MDVALNYALEKLRGLGINRSKEEVRNKIQEAWFKLDKLPNQQNIDQENLTEVLRAEVAKVVQLKQ
jgi:hypothetical protein